MRYITAFGIGIIFGSILSAFAVLVAPAGKVLNVGACMRMCILILMSGFTGLAIFLPFDQVVLQRRTGFKNSLAYVGLVTTVGMFVSGFWFAVGSL